MISTERHRKARRKPCHAIAAQRARMARKQGRSRLIAILIFLWAILSGPFRPRLVSGPPSSHETDGADWPITDYERGLGGDTFLRPRRAAGVGRYRSRPSLSRLMTDLRHPAARKDAAAALEARVADPVTLEWIRERIAQDDISRLAIWVRPGKTEGTVMAAWRGEADAALLDVAPDDAATSPDRSSLLQVAKLLESIAGTESPTLSGPKRPHDI
jgi:hypothetical protein